MDSMGDGCLSVILVVAFAFIIFVLGASSGSDIEREKAVKAKVGKYVVEPATGKRSFVYGVVEVETNVEE